MTKLSKYITCLAIGLAITMGIKTNVYAAHSHTDDCYAGTIHHCDGNENTYGLCYSTPIYHTHNDSCYSLVCEKTNIEEKVENNTSLCSVCGSTYVLKKVTCLDCGANETYTYCSNPECENNLKTSPELKHNELSLSKAKEINNLSCTKTTTTIEKYEKTCKKEDGAYYYGTEKVSPICDTIVTSIEPQVATQTTEKPNLNIIATYLDGHTAVIPATSNSYVSTMTYNNAEIQLNYYGLVDNATTYGNLSTTISLTTPTEIPTITDTPTPTEEVTQTPTITEEITQTPTKGIVEDTKAPTPIEEKKDIKESSSKVFFVVLVVLIVIMVIVIITTLVLFVKNKDEVFDDGDDEDDNDEDDNNDNQATINQSNIKQNTNMKNSIDPNHLTINEELYEKELSQNVMDVLNATKEEELFEAEDDDINKK